MSNRIRLEDDSFTLGSDNSLSGRSRELRKDNMRVPQGELFQKITDDYGNTLLKPVKANIVCFGGALTVLENLCGITPDFMPETINEKLGIFPTGTPTGNNKLALFGGGTGGAALANGSVIAPDIKQDNVLDMIPMRYLTGTITGTDANKYFMKRDGGAGAPSSYYLKEFDGPVTIKGLWKNGVDSDTDGTEITTDISTSTSTEGIEVMAEIEISLNVSDFREYFEETSTVANARYNTFGFYTGEKIGDEYHNVRLYSVITFNNRPLDLETSSQFVYRIYALI